MWSGVKTVKEMCALVFQSLALVFTLPSPSLHIYSGNGELVNASKGSDENVKQSIEKKA